MDKKKIISKILNKLAKTENDEFVPVFQKLLGHLSYLSMFYQSAHWLAKDENYYADHELYQRLYEATSGEIDKLAERSIVVGNEDSVDRQIIIDYMSQKEKEIKEKNKSNIELAIMLEEEMLQMLADDTKRMSQGTQNLLDDMSDVHEEHMYLLTQRNKDD